MIVDIIQLAGSATFGLLAGALLTEGCILVPHWKTIPAQNFHDLHAEVAPKLFRYFAPLTTIGPMLLLLAAIAAVATHDSRAVFSVVAAASAMAVVATFFLYFKKANEALALPEKTADGLRAELDTWERWHWFRTVIAVAGFIISLMAL